MTLRKATVLLMALALLPFAGVRISAAPKDTEIGDEPKSNNQDKGDWEEKHQKHKQKFEDADESGKGKGHKHDGTGFREKQNLAPEPPAQELAGAKQNALELIQALSKSTEKGAGANGDLGVPKPTLGGSGSGLGTGKLSPADVEKDLKQADTDVESAAAALKQLNDAKPRDAAAIAGAEQVLELATAVKGAVEAESQIDSIKASGNGKANGESPVEDGIAKGGAATTDTDALADYRKLAATEIQLAEAYSKGGSKDSIDKLKTEVAGEKTAAKAEDAVLTTEADILKAEAELKQAGSSAEFKGAATLDTKGGPDLGGSLQNYINADQALLAAQQKLAGAVAGGKATPADIAMDEKAVADADRTSKASEAVVATEQEIKKDEIALHAKGGPSGSDGLSEEDRTSLQAEISAAQAFAESQAKLADGYKSGMSEADAKVLKDKVDLAEEGLGAATAVVTTEAALAKLEKESKGGDAIKGETSIGSATGGAGAGKEGQSPLQDEIAAEQSLLKYQQALATDLGGNGKGTNGAPSSKDLADAKAAVEAAQGAVDADAAAVAAKEELSKLKNPGDGGNGENIGSATQGAGAGKSATPEADEVQALQAEIAADLKLAGDKDSVAAAAAKGESAGPLKDEVEKQEQLVRADEGVVSAVQSLEKAEKTGKLGETLKGESSDQGKAQNPEIVADQALLSSQLALVKTLSNPGGATKEQIDAAKAGVKEAEDAVADMATVQTLEKQLTDLSGSTAKETGKADADPNSSVEAGALKAEIVGYEQLAKDQESAATATTKGDTSGSLEQKVKDVQAFIDAEGAVDAAALAVKEAGKDGADAAKQALNDAEEAAMQAAKTAGITTTSGNGTGKTATDDWNQVTN